MLRRNAVGIDGMKRALLQEAFLQKPGGIQNPALAIRQSLRAN